VAIDDLFEVAPEVSIERYGRTMRFASAIDSESRRPGGCSAERNTATGCASFSMMTSAPSDTRSSNASEIARRFRLRDVNHVLGHNVIIHRCSPSEENCESGLEECSKVLTNVPLLNSIASSSRTR